MHVLQGIPAYSIFTLFTETLITIAVMRVIYVAYREGRFLHYLAGFALVYEILFNISYMATRMMAHVEIDRAVYPGDPFHIAIAIFHGTFSLIMFVALLAFMYFAWRAYDRGENFFRDHRKLTILFIVSWLIAISSGFLFFYEAYFSPEEPLTRSVAEAQR